MVSLKSGCPSPHVTAPQASLSPKQAKVLGFIEKEISRVGRAPSYRDIARHFGYDAIGTVQDHIKALIRKGFLEKEGRLARSITLAHRSKSIDVPILGAVPAGRPIEAIEDARGSLSVAVRLQGGADLYALRVVGESMIEAGILDGDFVVVRKQSHAENGEIVVAIINGEATVKFLDRRQGKIRLLPANPRFEPIEVEGDAENLIQGKVVSVQRYY